MSAYQTPILFLIFNRPDLTTIVFEEIRKQKPKYLFVAADGPRNDHPGEDEKCAAARKSVIESIDWDCNVKTLFRAENLGCGNAVSEAISWFFEHVDEGVILEDDCLPNKSFFTFCSELLDRYRKDERIMHISGNNYQNGKWRGEGSYYFSQFPHIWGWATWKRAWQGYDLSLKDFPDFEKDRKIFKVVKDKIQAEFWLNVLRSGFTKTVDTWDYAWFFTFFLNNGYAILPNHNLVSNIGFGADATHTHHKDCKNENLPVFKLRNLVHPKIKLNVDADKFTYYYLYHNYQSITDRIKRKIKSKIKDLKKNTNVIKNVMKQIISITGYSVHFKKLRNNESTVLSYKTGRHILYYPSGHPLINTMANYPDYSQNISRICKIAKKKYSDLHIIDVGANIGDTVAFIKNEVNCPILAIEGDNEYFQFLKLNTENIDDVWICKAFLDELNHTNKVNINKSVGTLSLYEEKNGEATEFYMLDNLLEKFPHFKSSKILKIDTDGYDIRILNGSTKFINKCKPIIFFEFDINFYSSANVLIDFIKSLEDIEYTQIIVYDNFGRFISKLNLENVSVLKDLIEYTRNSKTIYYYDLCVFHYEDSDLCLALYELENSYTF
ncbi:MAG: protein containing nucleotide-diphospho-sugar transferase domain [Sphingobacteriales bacterium]|nr:protein containing nucleotide-diphospho-sugar transferase domain [Sphingobacteriales bacterium]